ncbi:MAG: class I SAM-dependent methyltransferase [Rhodospirillales bacterium]
MSFYDLDPVSETYRDAGKRVEIALQNEYLGEFLDYFVKSAKKGDVRSVLDVGCGAGAITNEVRRKLGKDGISFVGVDLSPTQIKNARDDLADIGNLSFAVSSGDRLPFADGAFDIVYETSALTWSRDPRAFINEMVRVSGNLVAFHAGVTPSGGESYACIFGWVRRDGPNIEPQFTPSDYGIDELYPRHLVPTDKKGLLQYPVSVQKFTYLSEKDFSEIVDGGGIEVLYKKVQGGSHTAMKRQDGVEGPPTKSDLVFQERFSSRCIVARKV